MSQKQAINNATSAYIDVIYLIESLVAVALVRKHLLNNGLIFKDLIRLEDESKILECMSGGITASSDEGEIGKSKIFLKRLLANMFPLCEKLIGDFLVCSWLRVATIFIKQQARALT